MKKYHKPVLNIRQIQATKIVTTSADGDTDVMPFGASERDNDPFVAGWGGFE